MKKAVITGIGPVTPIGVGINSFWKSAIEGASGTSALTSLPLNFPVETFSSRIVAAVKDEWLPAADESEDDARFFRFGSLACELALKDAGLEDIRGDKTAVVLGNAVGGTTPMEASYLSMKDGDTLDRRKTPYKLLKQMSFHYMAHEIAEKYGCEGTTLTVSTGCTAGVDAVAAGFELIKYGKAQTVIVGAAEAPITPVVYAAFDVIGALSKNNANPLEASRPFDKDRDGFVLGEGAGFLILEEKNQAIRRNARIYAEITGYASVSNSYHMTDLPAEGTALADCMKLALEDAGLAAEDIDHINAHGSSTPQNDICETNAIKNVFGRHAQNLTVNSLKAIIGHALGASNAIEIAACAAAIERQHMFPTAHLDAPGDGCDLDYIPKQSRRMNVRHLLKLSSGFSGIHSALVMSAPF
ncbi:MAG TPA: beta-ketoacyl-[acyl-carrier-protein] synthase family protein [Pyrinomonadaceae bacterium]